MVYFYVVLGVSGIGLRQVDRWWFALFRDPGVAPRSVVEVLARQRVRANDVTPVVLLVGIWLEIAAWWGLATQFGVLGSVVAALMTAVKFRQLQETSHFAAHGVLFRRLSVGDAVAELTVHAPLGFRTVPSRRERHVRQHHPNAAVPEVDPNLDELITAGLRPGASAVQFAAGVLFPLTPRGLAGTLRDLAANLSRTARWRIPFFLLIPLAAYLLGGVPLLLAGYLIPRLLLYPQLAWMSLLVEHTWFEPATVRDPRLRAEAERCVRVYPHRRMLEFFARCVWLPYGDLFHFAHSAHPSVRWNYLPHVERLIGHPERVAPSVVFGRSSVLTRLRQATRISLPHTVS